MTAWNPLDKAAGISLSGSNLVATGTDYGSGVWQRVRADTGLDPATGVGSVEITHTDYKNAYGAGSYAGLAYSSIATNVTARSASGAIEQVSDEWGDEVWRNTNLLRANYGTAVNLDGQRWKFELNTGNVTISRWNGSSWSVIDTYSVPSGTGLLYPTVVFNTNAAAAGDFSNWGVSTPSVTPAAATHGHAATSPTLAAKASVSPNNAAHAHAATSPTLAAKTTVAPDAAAHAHSATSPTLAAKSTVSPADAAHGHSANSPSLGAKTTVAPANALHGHSATAPSIAAKAIVSPNNAAHAQEASQPSVGTTGTLSPAAAAHAHSVTSPTLAAKTTVQPAGASHGHTAGSPGLTAKATVNPAAALHGLSSTRPVIVPSGDIEGIYVGAMTEAELFIGIEGPSDLYVGAGSFF